MAAVWRRNFEDVEEALYHSEPKLRIPFGNCFRKIKLFQELKYHFIVDVRIKIYFLKNHEIGNLDKDFEDISDLIVKNSIKIIHAVRWWVLLVNFG